ncbi:hypothetical protein K1719_008298 [Acacia pycnantha]|nr:hypothetical protein K1719_008298 [Acacia pycnantha]
MVGRVREGLSENITDHDTVMVVPESSLEMYEGHGVQMDFKENLHPGGGMVTDGDTGALHTDSRFVNVAGGVNMNMVEVCPTAELADYRGAASKGVATMIRDIKFQYKVDLFVLLEPRISGRSADKVIKSWGFSHSVRMEAEGFSGGIWLLWNLDDLAVDVKIINEQFIHCSLCFGGKEMMFTAVYGSPMESKRVCLWDLLYNLSTETSMPWILGGDFNEIKTPSEQMGGGRVNETRCRRFNNWIEDCRLIDMDAQGPFFTWKGPKWEGLERVYKRLDRCFCSVSWLEKFVDAEIRVLPRICSDHHPLLVRLSRGHEGRRQRLFKYEAMWKSHELFNNVLERSWRFNGEAHDKLAVLQVDLSKWNKEVFGMLEGRKRRLYNRLNGIQKSLESSRNPFLATVICAKPHNLQIRIRSGGHDYEGLSYVSQVRFIVLDMFNLSSIQIDIRNETAVVQAGATTGEVYYNTAKQSDVHTFPAGVCFTLGAGGHISGGDYGNLMRKYGLSSDNIIDAELVDVNGIILNRKTMGEDLFWAIRGGGAASFGVVLSWKIKLVSVPSQVTVFRVKKTVQESATDLVHKWQIVASELDKDLFIRVMPIVINGTKDGKKKTTQVSFIGQFLRKIDRLVPLMNKSFPELGLKESDCTEMPWVNTTLFWYDYPIGTSIDELLAKHKQPTLFSKSKSDYVKEPIPKSAIQYIWKLMIEGEKTWMQWNPYGGKMSEISSSETPFPHRAGNLFLIQYYTHWEKEGSGEINHHMNISRHEQSIPPNLY